MKLNGDLVLVRGLDSIEIECLPSDIPNHLVANLSKLQTEDDEVLVSDLAMPDGVKVLTAHDHVVFSLTLSRAGITEGEEAAEATTTSDVEVVAKGKAAKEGEEGAPERK
jgi:large subunit ribosomal protein L25